jgi:hypothetical protein
MNDTSPKIAELVREMLMARSGAERVLMGSRMFDFARAMILASFPSGLTDLEIKRRLCERLYGQEVQVEASSSISVRLNCQNNSKQLAPDRQLN